MLYVSRCVSESSYGVVDTDDDVEDVVSMREIFNAVVSCNLRIVGVTIDEVDAEPYISGIEPYQDMRYHSSVQSKALMLYGVEVRVFRDEIVLIRVNYDAMPGNEVSIRLSDFGKSYNFLAPVISVRGNCLTEKTVRLIFDEKILVVGRPEDLEYYSGVVFDFTDYPDDEYVEQLYKFMHTDSLPVTEFLDFIVDCDRRLDYWRCVGIVDGDYVPDTSGPDWHNNDIEHFKEYSFRLAQYYDAEFRGVLSLDVSKVFFIDPVYFDHRRLVKEYTGHTVDELIACNDFETMRRQFLDILTLMKVTSVVPTHSLNLLNNFLKYFDAPGYLQSMFVDLCHRIGKEINERCKCEGDDL